VQLSCTSRYYPAAHQYYYVLIPPPSPLTTLLRHYTGYQQTVPLSTLQLKNEILVRTRPFIHPYPLPSPSHILRPLRILRSLCPTLAESIQIHPCIRPSQVPLRGRLPNLRFWLWLVPRQVRHGILRLVAAQALEPLWSGLQVHVACVAEVAALTGGDETMAEGGSCGVGTRVSTGLFPGRDGSLVKKRGTYGLRTLGNVVLGHELPRKAADGEVGVN